MSLFSRVLIVCILVAGCGFTPVYGPGGAAEGLRNEISYAAPRDFDGFALIQALEDRLGTAAAARYRLTATILIEEDEVGVSPEQEITRFNLLGDVSFTLTDIASDVVLTRGRVTSLTGYSATGTTVATRSAEQDARERLMVILADQITARLLATATDWRE